MEETRIEETRIEEKDEKREAVGTEVKSAVEGKEKGRKERKLYRITGSFIAKLVAFFVLFVSAAVALGSAYICYVNVELGIYESERNKDKAILRSLTGVAYEYAEETWFWLMKGNEKEAMAVLADTNAELVVFQIRDSYLKLENQALWQSDTIADANAEFFVDTYFYVQKTEQPVYLSGAFRLQENTEYVCRVYFDREFPVEDAASRWVSVTEMVFELRYAAIWALVTACVVCLNSFIFLLCAAGRKSGRQEIVPTVFTALHFDLYTVGMIFCMSILVPIAEEMTGGGILSEGIVLSVFFLLEGILAMLYLMEFAIRLKQGKWWKNTLVYVVLRAAFRVVIFLVKGMWSLIRGIPLVITNVIIFCGITILEMFGVALFVEGPGVPLWILEKLVLFVVVVYVALNCKKLMEAGKAIAEGKENYIVDTSKMIGAMKEHGENLNSVSKGITRAVAARMKSEHLKTELITNVSHDLKTPLTSIINYADLICEEKSDNPKIAEYSEVLLRQSKRMKKLLEDLMDAAKATTGNLEVNMEPCEAGVLLSQAVGEYEQKMQEKGLQLLTRQPEQPAYIMADGRHLWRVFDNLLNNIYKYAQEGTRVYLRVEAEETSVCISFRNVSKYALDISAEELEERFVRGDKSRHMEGNGLGLSIAKSLMELQNGKMEIVIDGDLFKVNLIFNKLEDV